MSQDVGAAPEFTRHVREMWGSRESLPELIENAEAVGRTLETPGFKVIEAVLAAEVAALDRKLGGRALEHAEYVRLHGRRAALLALRAAGESVIAIAKENGAKASRELEGESSRER